MRSIRKDNNDHIYINLASKEYSQSISPYLNKDEQMITIDFQVIKNHMRKTITTYAKTARGNMVEYIMKNRIDDPEQLKQFHIDHWYYEASLSDHNHYVFLKEVI